MIQYILKNKTLAEVQVLWMDLVELLKEITQLEPTSKKDVPYLDNYIFDNRLGGRYEINFNLHLEWHKECKAYVVNYVQAGRITHNNKVAQQVKPTIVQHLKLHSYCLEDGLVLAQKNIDQKTLHILNILIQAEENLSPEIAAIFEQAFYSDDEDLQITFAWMIPFQEGLLKHFKLLVYKQVRIQVGSKAVLEQLQYVKEIIQEEERLTQSTYNLSEFFEEIQEDLEIESELSLAKQASLKHAYCFVDAPNHADILYSKIDMQASPEEILTYAMAYEKWHQVIEFYYHHLSIYEPGWDFSCSHPLGVYIIASQFLWHRYKHKQAELHLIRSLHLAENLKDNKGNLIIPKRKLATALYMDEHDAFCLYNASFYVVSYFYLAEIYEKRGLVDKAIQHYEQFLVHEPNFMGKDLIWPQGGVSQISLPIPDSKKAKESIELLRNYGDK